MKDKARRCEDHRIGKEVLLGRKCIECLFSHN